ncbi:MAG: asparagine synthetase A [Candidatus Thermoplasmatota archaeon]|nr:asparagine synthetase A [Candidatus Thermoplasmatota archaeon]
MQETVTYELKEHLKSERLKIALEVNTLIRRKMSDILVKEGFIEIPPVIFSSVTDPLNHPVYDPTFDYEGTRYSLTKSMIFHKQMIVQAIPKVYTFSPNVRLETADKAKSGRHLLEFTQLDLEMLDSTREDAMKIGEKLVSGAIKEVTEKMPGKLKILGRELHVPKTPFKVYKYTEAKEKYGKDFEQTLSELEKEPFWIIDIPLKEREFYDREKDDEKGILRDMDLMYPEGFNEAISGGEREYEIERIKERILAKGQTFEQFKWFLDYAEGGLRLSSGFGIGIERLIRYICGFERIEETHPFPKTPGKFSI